MHGADGGEDAEAEPSRRKLPGRGRQAWNLDLIPFGSIVATSALVDRAPPPNSGDHAPQAPAGSAYGSKSVRPLEDAPPSHDRGCIFQNGVVSLTSLGVFDLAGLRAHRRDAWTINSALGDEKRTGRNPRQRKPLPGSDPRDWYHAGNFIGPARVRPHRPTTAPHRTRRSGGLLQELQGGRAGAPPGIRPQLQWELWRGRHTPYLGLAFRYARVWLDERRQDRGFLVGGWQIRWQSGVGLLVDRRLVHDRGGHRDHRGAYHSSGGLFGTYEVGLRYFF